MPGRLFISYSGKLGGAERVLLDAATGVGGESVLACPDGELAAQARSAGLGVLTLPARGLDLRIGARARARATRDLTSHAREVRSLAGALEPDLIVAWGMRSAIACLLAAPAVPFAVAHHDFLPGAVIGHAVRAACRRAAVVVAPSQAVADDLDPAGVLGDRLRVLAPGIDVESFSDAGAPANPPEVLVLGSLVAWKRPEFALEIFARALRAAPELRLRLVGAPITGSEPTLARLRTRAA
ncbi:MAG: glycosyltransferase, partial [Solirubrobacteraceae bacterium]